MLSVVCLVSEQPHMLSVATLRAKKMIIVRNTKRGKYHCTVDLQFDWFGLVCFANKNINCQLSYSWFQTSQTGGQQYSDTSPFSIPCNRHEILTQISAKETHSKPTLIPKQIRSPQMPSENLDREFELTKFRQKLGRWPFDWSLPRQALQRCQHCQLTNDNHH